MPSFERQIAEMFQGPQAPASRPGLLPARTTASGWRTSPEDRIAMLNRYFSVDLQLRQTILDLREMDKLDPRVKKIHERTARAAVKGGLILHCDPKAKRVHRLWKEYVKRCDLHRREKLESDMRGAMMEGNLPLEWIVDRDSRRVVGCSRLPTETIKPIVGEQGRFQDPMRAYEQWDWLHGKKIATFALWQLTLVRVRPDNYDNWASLGRPYLDATRSVWKQLRMTERDMVIRRHDRAPQRLNHILEGATEEELEAYKQKVYGEKDDITTDFFQNKKGGVQAVQGDQNMWQVADVVHLLDTFFSGAPAPKGLFGYTGELSRDILEDLKRDYYDELDALQDTVTFGYELGFRLELLLRGINPDAYPLQVQFAERRTDTPNQRADLALKHQALGVPSPLVFRTAGLDPEEVERYREEDEARGPYPGGSPAPAPGQPRVNVTPGNARKGESATSVSTSTSS